MKRTKKQLLGFTGLAAVGIMTAIAYGVPAPNASAATQNTTVNVQVTEGNPNNIFASPRDGSETVSSLVNVVTNYSQAKRLDFYLTYKDESGNTQRVDLPSYSPANDAGTYNFDLDVSPYGFGEFVLHTSVTGLDNVTRETDTVSFTYSAMIIDTNQGVDDKKNPIVSVEIGSSIEKVVVAIFDKDGNPAFVDENGNVVNIELNRSDIDPATGKILVALPFEKYGAKAGTYAVVFSAYDKDNKLVSMQTAFVDYSPLTPDTPNTGMLSIGDLNISRVDYLVTGMIAFCAAVGLAVFLIFRKSRR